MQKYNILSFTLHHVVPNLFEFLFSLKTKWLSLRLSNLKGKRCKSIINFVRTTFTCENKVHYFYDAFELLWKSSTEEQKSCRFGVTWGWTNDDRIIFDSSVPLISRQTLHYFVSSIVLNRPASWTHSEVADSVWTFVCMAAALR